MSIALKLEGLTDEEFGQIFGFLRGYLEKGNADSWAYSLVKKLYDQIEPVVREHLSEAQQQIFEKLLKDQMANLSGHQIMLVKPVKDVGKN